MATLAAVPDRYRHLAQSAWDVEFLAKPTWVQWLDVQLVTEPLLHGEQLVDYVRTRVEQQKAAVQAPRPPQPQPQPQSVASFPSHHNGGMNSASSSNGHDEFSDVVDLTSYAGAVDDVAMNGGNYLSNGNGLEQTGGLNPNYLHTAFTTVSPATTPSPMAQYPHQAAYGGPIKPFGGSSALALQQQLIEQEQARRAHEEAAASRAYLQHPAASASSMGFDPQAFHSQPQAQAPSFAISPAALSNPLPAPVASTSTSAPAPAVKAVKKSTSARAASPANSTSSTVKRSRTASPPVAVNSYDSSQWTTFQDGKLSQHLNSKRISGAALSTAQYLVKNLGLFSHTDKSSTLSPWGDASDVPPEGRAQVLSTLLKYAKDDFWKAWLEVGASGTGGGGKGKEKESSSSSTSSSKVKSEGLELFQRWLDGAAKGYASTSKEGKEREKEKGSASEASRRKRKEMEQTTLVLVLQVLAKLPVTLDHLIAYPIPRLVKRIGDKAPDGGVKAAAVQLVAKWQKLQEAARADAAKNGAASGSTSTVKRKSDAADGAAKKAKTTTTTDSKKAAPATLPVGPKVPLPSFKKEAANPFLAAMSGMKKGTPAAPPPVVAKPVLPSAKKKAPVDAAEKEASVEADPKPKEEKMGKNGKKKKTVRWRPEEELVAIKLIERAVYEDDENSEMSGARVFAEGEDAAANFRDMNMQEGQTLHMHLDEEIEMDEEIDWYEPVAIIIPETEDFDYFRQEPKSAERDLQALRESTAMAINLSSTPPDSPAEPPEYTGEAVVTRTMPLGADIANDDAVLDTIALAQASRAKPGVFAGADDLSSILGELQAPAAMAHAPAQAQGQAQAPPVLDETTLATIRNFAPEQIESMIRSNPRFEGMTLEQLGLAPPEPQHQQHQHHQPYQPPAQHHQPQHGGHYAPPSAAQHAHYGPQDHYPGNDGGGGYQQQAWQQAPPAYAPHQPSAWPPQAPAGPSLYHGYVPPPPSSHHATDLRGPGKTPGGGFHQNKAGRPACRFYRQPRGCDRGELCAFRHDI